MGFPRWCVVGVAAVASVVLAACTPAQKPPPSSAIGYPPAWAQVVDRTQGSCVVDLGTPATSSSTSSSTSSAADDTAAFEHAMTVALAKAPHCYPDGPAGPQAVVYVPPGVYRVAKLHFQSNVRLEVDAAATIQEPANRPAQPSKHNIPAIVWDTAGSTGAPLTNVSIVGVGSAMTATKQQALADGGPVLDRIGVADDFTLNLDPQQTGSTNYNPGLEIVNASYFLVQNVFSIQNATDQALTHVTAWPTSSRAVILIHAAKASPVSTAGPGAADQFIQPKHGRVVNQVNVDSPRGFGPNQVNAGSALAFHGIYTLGGTALRLETDGSSNHAGVPDRGATLTDVTASDIVGQNCNRALSLSPHAQHNGSVRVEGLWSYGCDEAVVANVDKHVPASRRGSFADAVVSDVHVVAGSNAQLDSTSRLWETGASRYTTFVAPQLTWRPQIVGVRSKGSFNS